MAGPRNDVHHPVFARVYERLSPSMDRAGFAEHRQSLLAGLTGDVLEVGAGTGGNFAHYPETVRKVRAVEPEPRLRTAARQEAERVPVEIEVVAGVADRLPAEDGSVDAVVTSLVLCSVPDQAAALREIVRVLRPGGQLRFLEHVRADGRFLSRAQRLLDATVWPFFVGGCHTGRDTEGGIRAAGLRIDRIDHVRFPELRVTGPTTHHILGTATRPDQAEQPAPPDKRGG